MYTKTVNYIPVASDFFDEGVIEFDTQEINSKLRISNEDSPVYSRAHEKFRHSLYNYPAAPVYMGQRDLMIPDEEIYVLRLLVKSPWSGDGQRRSVFLPNKLSFLYDMLMEAIRFQKGNFPFFDDRFIYITVRSGMVKSNRDDEFHVDGFQGNSDPRVPRHIPEQNYVWCSNNPTLFSMQPYFIDDLDPSVHNVHSFFEANTNKNDLYAVQPKGLYIMDPYHVHARPKILEETQRTFVRITFSPVEIRDDTNTPNPFIERGPYNRPDIRNSLIPYVGNGLENQGLTRVSI